MYLSDASTLSIVRAYTDSLAQVVSVDVPVEHDWLFFGKGPFKLGVNVSSKLPLSEVSYSVRRDLDLMDYAAEPILSSSVQVRTLPRRTVRATLPLGELEPGFYQVCINGTKTFNIGVNPEQIQSPSDAPEDFDAFWQSTLSELAEVPMEVKWTLLLEHSSLKRECYRVEMPSWGGATMGGIIFIPTAEGRYPVRMNFMGYGADVYYEDPDWHADRIDFTVSVRDQGIFKEGNSKWIDRLFSNIDTYLVKRLDVPVIIGEWGGGSGEDSDANVRFATYFSQKAKDAGVAAFWWMGLSDGADRSTPEWTMPRTKDAILKAYKNN